MLHKKIIAIFWIFLIIVTSCIAETVVADFLKEYKEQPISFDKNIEKCFLNKNYTLNIFIYTDTFEHFENNYVQLANILSKMNVDTVYLAFNNKKFATTDTYSKNIRYFITLAHKKNIKVSALIYNSIYPYFSKSYRNTVKSNLKNFLSKSGRNEKFDSITSDLEPNSLRKNIGVIPPSFKLRWDNNNGWKTKGANNKLLVMTLDLLRELRGYFPDMPIYQTTQSYFNSYIDKGLLNVGSCSDFLKYCNAVIIMCYVNDAKKVALLCRKSLKETSAKNSVVIAVKTSDKGNSNSSFAGNNINELTQNLNIISAKSSNFSSFDGLAVYNLKGMLQIFLRSKLNCSPALKKRN
jgi:hypothetical protein